MKIRWNNLLKCVIHWNIGNIFPGIFPENLFAYFRFFFLNFSSFNFILKYRHFERHHQQWILMKSKPFSFPVNHFHNFHTQEDGNSWISHSILKYLNWNRNWIFRISSIPMDFNEESKCLYALLHIRYCVYDKNNNL